MDKRTFLFVISLALSLFVVNLFFTYREEERKRVWYEQQQFKKKERHKQIQADVTKRTSSPAELPLAAIYTDSQGKALSSVGIKIDTLILFLSWTDGLPKTLFSKPLDSKDPLKSYSLIVAPAKTGEPALYAEGTPASLNYSEVPELGTHDLQLVSFSTENQHVEILLGEYVDSHLNIPAKKLPKADESEANNKVAAPVSEKAAIALYKTDKGYLPAGIYHLQQDVFVTLDHYPLLAPYLAQVFPFQAPKAKSQKEAEQYYVLENRYQQLVFSNYGGALAEINLPFQAEDKTNPVREIEFDREIVADHPKNAHFPSSSYYTAETSNKNGVLFHTEGKLGGYYPLLRRHLRMGNGARNGRNFIPIDPHYYAVNIVSEYPEVAQLIYQVKEFDHTHIVFEAIQPHRRITKTFSIAEEEGAPYCINLTIKIEGDAKGLWLTTGVPEVEWLSGSIAPALKYRITRHQKGDVESIALPKESLSITSVYPDWICNSNGFFGIILDPLGGTDPGFKAVHVAGTTVPSRLIEVDEEYHRFKAANMPGYALLMPLKASGGTQKFRLFAGPFAESTLKTVDKTFSDPTIGYNPDYLASQSFHGWFAFISEPFAKFLFILMKLFHQFTGSWAFSIVLLTLALRLMLYPLNAWSMKSMLRMQEIAPAAAALQERYKKDPKKLQLEIAALYREAGVNPLSGCFPLLIQMPFLIGMFDLLKSTFELRGASFIPGWIDNLAAPDVLFRWHYPLFFIGTEFHLLPILLGLVMLLQQRMSSTLPKDVNLLTDQQRQQRAMGNLMTVLFAVMFYNVPSGLNIYWLSSMLLGILQQWLTSKRLGKAKLEVKNLKAKG